MERQQIFIIIVLVTAIAYFLWRSYRRSPTLFTMKMMSIGGRLVWLGGWLIVKLFAIVAWFVYLISPVDLMPDIIPLIGWLDDFGASLLTLFFLRKGYRVSSKLSRALPSGNSRR